MNAFGTASLSLNLADRLSPYLIPGGCRLKVYRSPSAAQLAANAAATSTLVFYGLLPVTNVVEHALD